MTVAGPDSKVHGANMGPTWVLSAPDGPHVGQMNLALQGCNYRREKTQAGRSCRFLINLPACPAIIKTACNVQSKPVYMIKALVFYVFNASGHNVYSRGSQWWILIMYWHLHVCFCHRREGLLRGTSTVNNFDKMSTILWKTYTTFIL